MKIKLFFACFLCGLSLAFAQKPAEQPTVLEYIKKIPALPEKICSCTSEARNTFQASVSELRQAILDDANERERKLSEYMQSKEGDIKSNMINMSGMSEEDVKKLQSGKKMTQAEKMEMANKMMQQQANMSMDEMKKLQNMSKAGQEARAQGYAAEQQAKARAGEKPKNQTGELAMALSSNVTEQRDLAAKLQTLQSDLQQKFDALKMEGQAEKAIMDKELEPYYKIMNSNNGEGATQKIVEEDKKARAQIKARQDRYCEKMTPKMVAFLAESRTVVENALPEYDRMDELKYQSLEIPAGKKLDRKVTGIESLKAVGFYLGFVDETFSFRLN